MRLERLGTAALVAALAVAPAQAAEIFVVDRGHSDVGFQIRHLVTQVRGQFERFSGTIHMDPEQPERSSVEFTIDATSINTFNADRDEHLRGSDFFHTEEHPEITFKSSSIARSGENAYDVTGTLTMRGVAKTVALPVTFLGTVKDPWGNVKAGFETTLTLNRKDYGINWNAALDQGGFVLGDDVKVSINLEAGLQQAEEAGAGS